MKIVNLIGNVIWFVLTGWILGLEFLIGGLLCCLTVIGIPLGFACFRLAGFSLFPFGRELVPVEFTGEKKVAGSGCFNGLWFLLFGAWIATTCLLAGIIYCANEALMGQVRKGDYDGTDGV